jgi:hypothetical protein
MIHDSATQTFELVPYLGVHKSQVTELCMVAPNIFSIISAIFSLWTKMWISSACSEQKAPHNNEIHTSVQNCGSSVFVDLSSYTQKLYLHCVVHII